MRTGSEKYGTEIMKEAEVALFAEAAIENGTSISDTMQDIKMIDVLLHSQRLQKVCGPLTQRTRSGHFRKGSNFQSTMNKIIEGRSAGAFDY